MTIDSEFGVEISSEQFSERFLALHKQLFASTEFVFDDVTTHIYTPPKGTYQVDHSFFHDGDQWHLYHITGDLKKSDAYVECMASGDWEGAARNTVEPGIGHAVGNSLFDLRYVELLELQSLGDFDMITRSNGWVFSFEGRYGMLYGVRGRDGYVGFSLMWSTDLKKWTPGDSNPIFGPPSWAKPGATCKDVHIVEHEGVFLLYYITANKNGYCCVALNSTSDWVEFQDHGCVFESAPMLRGTMGIESVSVFPRNHIWHMFFTYGPGLWHAVSPTPMQFVHSRGSSYNVGTGFYCLGPFHATEIIEEASGKWWLTTDRKEETRRLNRQAGRLCYRGSYADEKTLEEGLYLSSVRWDGDQPLLERPRST